MKQRVRTRLGGHVLVESLEALGQGSYLFPGAGPQDAAAGPENGTPGACEQLCRLAEVLGRRLSRRGRFGVELGDPGNVGRAGQDIDRDLEEDGPGRRGERSAPRLG